MARTWKGSTLVAKKEKCKCIFHLFAFFRGNEKYFSSKLTPRNHSVTGIPTKAAARFEAVILGAYTINITTSDILTFTV